MLNVPAEIQAVIKKDSTLKNFRVHFPNGERADITNENIVYESVDFTESVCSDNVFRFGLAEASVIEFETVNVENIIGMTIECSMEYAVPSNLQSQYGEWYSIPYGTFIVDKCPRNHNNITHRKVVAYSVIKNMLTYPTFLQNNVSPVPSVNVPLTSMRAYLTGDVSAFSEDVRPNTGQSPQPNIYLYRSGGYSAYGYYSLSIRNGNGGQTYFVEAGKDSAFSGDKGYILEYEEVGEKTNEEVGMEVVNWLDSLGYDFCYDPNGKKIYESNEEALRFAYGFLFHPIETRSISLSNSNSRFYYRGHSIETNRFIPVFFDNNFSPEDSYANVDCLLGTNSSEIIISLTRTTDSATTSVNSITISGFKANATFKVYERTDQELGTVRFDNTLMATNAFMYNRFVSNRPKFFYGTMYAYSNVFSNREMMNGIAEMSSAFVHSERDGSISMETLDNNDPYRLSLSDVENSAWWDEYDVNPIGTVKYTFYNPQTEQIANNSYTFNPDAKSVYDLSGNALMESIDFSVIKAKTASKMENLFSWYVYTGSETGYVNGDFYYHNGTEWVSGGHYTDATSIANFILDRLFVPHVNDVNFTPVEIDIRALPFLEAGDAFTLTVDDGSVLNSYILNHEISGVQRLTDSITSVSGEVIEK